MNSSSKATRGELVKWLNATLLVNISSIEKAYNGAMACQIMDMLYPGSIVMQRVNFAAKDVFEIQKNYRLLQSAFTQKRLPYNINIEHLSKGRPQDNLELLQLLKSEYDRVYDGSDYNPIQRRMNSKGGKEINITSADLEVMENEMVMNSGRVSIESSRSQQLSIHNVRVALGTPGPRHQPSPFPSILNRNKLPSRSEEMKQKIQKLENALVERDHLIEALRKEGTTMYFTLQQVESFLQDAEDAGKESISVKEVLHVLYSNYHVEHPEEEEKWLKDGLSIGCVEDSIQQFD